MDNDYYYQCEDCDSTYFLAQSGGRCEFCGSLGLHKMQLNDKTWREVMKETSVW